jgi:hypothetical protein
LADPTLAVGPLTVVVVNTVGEAAGTAAAGPVVVGWAAAGGDVLALWAQAETPRPRTVRARNVGVRRAHERFMIVL